MKIFKIAVPMIFLTAFSSMVNAQYQESMRLFLFDDIYTSYTPSTRTISIEKTVENNQTDIGGINYSIFRAV